MFRHCDEWVWNQRVRVGGLRPEQRRRLELLPGWTWSVLEDQWEKGFEALARYAEREGHACPLGKHKEDDFPLGGWVNKQRNRYRDGKLSEERKQRLEALPRWLWNSREAAWEEAFERLQRYAKCEGNARPPRNYRDPDGFSLGRFWINTKTQVSHIACACGADLGPAPATAPVEVPCLSCGRVWEYFAYKVGHGLREKPPRLTEFIDY